MNQDFHDIIRVISHTIGRDVSVYDGSFLAKSLEKRLTATSINTAAAYLEYLGENTAEVEAFVSSLNITYSEFFRNRVAYAVLEQHILPKLIEEKKKSGVAELRIWSSGCAAGQEAYSIAILLDELLEAGEKAISFRIFATDNIEAELASARKGVYNSSAVQNVRLKHIYKYFTQHVENYTIVASLRDRIDFSFYDLLDERSCSPPTSIYGDFDIVFFSNLLFYYRPDVRRFILEKVYRSLSPNGYLVTGEVEKRIVEQSGGFREITLTGSIFQRTPKGM